MRRLFGRRARGRDEDAPENYGTDEPEVDTYGADDTVADYGTEEFEPFVPVEREYEAYEPYDDVDAYDVGDDDQYTDVTGLESAAGPRRRVRLPRPRLPRPRLPRIALRGVLRWDVLLVALVLVALGVFGTLLVQDRLSGDVVTLWPGALVAAAVVWLLVALLRRNVTSFLGAAALAGVGLSALMDTQDIAPVEETLFGVVLVTIGLGIVMRGFLLRTRDTA